MDNARDIALKAIKGMDNISIIDYRAIIRNNKILNYIIENPFCTPYQISGDLDINYASVSRTVKDLEYCKIIIIKVKIGSNNRTHKECFIPGKDHPLNPSFITSAEEVGDKINEVEHDTN